MAFNEMDYYKEYDPIKCPECEETQKNLEYAQDHFQKLVQILYKGDSINAFELDDVMQELACYLGEKFTPDHLPPVMRMYSLGQEIYNTTSDEVKALAK